MYFEILSSKFSYSSKGEPQLDDLKLAGDIEIAFKGFQAIRDDVSFQNKLRIGESPFAAMYNSGILTFNSLNCFYPY